MTLEWILSHWIQFEFVEFNSPNITRSVQVVYVILHTHEASHVMSDKCNQMFSKGPMFSKGQSKMHRMHYHGQLLLIIFLSPVKGNVEYCIIFEIHIALKKVWSRHVDRVVHLFFINLGNLKVCLVLCGWLFPFWISSNALEQYQDCSDHWEIHLCQSRGWSLRMWIEQYFHLVQYFGKRFWYSDYQRLC